jgi:hypothetical protein
MTKMRYANSWVLARVGANVSLVLSVLFVATLSALPRAAQSTPTRPAETRTHIPVDAELENLRTFARLYGYVRFFHPSDEAAATDWNRFAVHGASHVRQAQDPQALLRAIEELFLPIAPTLQVFPSHDPPEPLSLVLADTAGLELVAWQHLGVKLGSGDVFRSRRTGRQAEFSETGFARNGLVFQTVVMDGLQGMSFRLRAAARADEGSHLRLLARIDGRGGILWADDMEARPIAGREWERYEIEGTIPEEAARLYIGGFLDGAGRGWLDAFELDVRAEGGPWTAVELQNPRFEMGPADGPPWPEEITELEPGIFYVDMTRVSMSTFRSRLDELAAARGVVFDLRGSPDNNWEILTYLIDRPVPGPRFLTPRIIYPDRERVQGYDESGTLTLSPQQPRLTGRIVFLTNGRALSLAETVMSTIEAHGLAEIVGSPTAGAAGNNNWFEVPGGYAMGFTGMVGLRHDGSQHHNIGIEPTAPVERTAQGIREGRDEFMERAIELIRQDGADFGLR